MDNYDNNIFDNNTGNASAGNTDTGAENTVGAGTGSERAAGNDPCGTNPAGGSTGYGYSNNYGGNNGSYNGGANGGYNSGANGGYNAGGNGGYNTGANGGNNTGANGGYNGSYNGGTFNAGGNGDQNGEPRKKSHIAAKILIPVAAVALLVTSALVTVKVLNGRNNKNQIASATVGTTTEEAKNSESSAVSEETANTQEASTTESSAADKTTLTKEVNEVGTVSTSGSTMCLDVSEVVENVMPCVVAITDNLEYTSTYNPYNYYFGNGSYGSSGGTQETTASGSGVIIAENDTELLIVTNNHVVDNEGSYSSYTISSTGLKVQFSDGSTADAVIKGTDSDADLAVIAVQLSSLSASTKDAIRIAVVGDSDEIKVGSGVIAIGNALGYGQSVTTGIISAKDRAVTIDNITRSLLQTDAAINPGNSGGGLFDANGRLIGINSAKTSDTDVEGMGFAIPINSAADIIEELMNQVTVAEEDQGFIGVYGEAVSSTYVERYGYPQGVSITRITEGSPAEESGLQIYDIITAVNGSKVTSMTELQKKVQKHAAGETITLTISRPDGRSFKEIEIDVTLASRAEYLAGSESQTEQGNANDYGYGYGNNSGNGNNYGGGFESNEGEGETGSAEGENGEAGSEEDSDSLLDWFFNNF